MYRRVAMARRLTALPRPLALLALVTLLSLGLRIALIDEPCRTLCRTADAHLLVFDEVYYVNAARVIAGITPPTDQKYRGVPLGDDPNSEHPQLVKVMIAGSIELFGDNPFAWRLPSLLLGTIAILAMFALVRAAGGSDWLALVAATLMAADNLALVHGRIATLDVPALALMLGAAIAYLRGRPLVAGILIGIGTAMKLVAPYLLVVVVLLELFRALPELRSAAWPVVRGAARRIEWCVAGAAATFIALLALLDRLAPPFDPVAMQRLGGSPFTHLSHMLSYGASQTSPNGPTGIASYPWDWLVDLKPITYLNINPDHPAPGLLHIHPAAHFIGVISPAIMLLALPSLVFVAWRVLAARRGRLLVDGEVPALALAWSLGTFLPFVVLSIVFSRTSYLYYMVVVMPGIYLAVGDVLVRWRRHWPWLALWGIALVGSLVALYPFTPLP
jgi:predicted membrane-bound dolichyl-phosphate-mannose-protein mannosyltransferase